MKPKNTKVGREKDNQTTSVLSVVVKMLKKYKDIFIRMGKK